MKEHTINRLKTFRENLWSLSKAAAIPAVALLGMNLIGFNPIDEIKLSQHHLVETAIKGGSFAIGLATGIAQNAVLIKSTLNSISGKTEAGNYQPARKESDGTHVFQMACIDGRRIDKKGAAVAGSYGPLGSAFIGLTGSMIAQGVAPNTILGDFATGYFLGSNILTEAYSHLAIFKEIGRLAKDSKNSDHRIKIEMMDHWDGCGAEGFTNPLTYWLKFKAHKLTLADLTVLPNEIAGYIYVNAILSPAIGILSGGRISLSAVLKHSAMEKHVSH